ncbi:hypothetical protein C8J57DRAFT_1234820 [Mycena rebaudengoi]|nr:hypothetical protein C8J57DRAFT_1234820 [Mycena rebaudengoi]
MSIILHFTVLPAVVLYFTRSCWDLSQGNILATHLLIRRREEIRDDTTTRPDELLCVRPFNRLVLPSPISAAGTRMFESVLGFMQRDDARNKRCDESRSDEQFDLDHEVRPGQRRVQMSVPRQAADYPLFFNGAFIGLFVPMSV